MSTIVNSLSDFYYDFFDGDVFSMEKAERFFNKCADNEHRVTYIRETYETILSSSTINETSFLAKHSHKRV